MGIRAGELRHRITVQTLQTGGRDEDGFEIDPVWVDYVQIWAKISPLSSRDDITAKPVAQKWWHVWRCVIAWI